MEITAETHAIDYLVITRRLEALLWQPEQK